MGQPRGRRHPHSLLTVPCHPSFLKHPSHCLPQAPLPLPHVTAAAQRSLSWCPTIPQCCCSENKNCALLFCSQPFYHFPCLQDKAQTMTDSMTDSLSYSAPPTSSQHQPPLPSAFNHCRSLRSLWTSHTAHTLPVYLLLPLPDGFPFLIHLANSSSSLKLSSGFISSEKPPLTFLPASGTPLLRCPVLCSRVFLYRNTPL